MAVTNILRLVMANLSVVLIFGAGCPKHNMQFCSNCRAVPSVCNNVIGSQPLNVCEVMCLTNPDCMLGEHDHRSGNCFQYDCSQIEEDVNAAGYFTLRKVCQLSDCLKYKLTTLHGQAGTCHILETHTGVVSVVDCSMLCLDTDSCRGSTFYENGTCVLHDCGNNTLGPINTIFIERSCFGDTLTSLPSPTLSKKTPKYSRPSILTTARISVAHTPTVETVTVTLSASSVLPGNAKTNLVDTTLNTTLAYLFYTYTQYSLSNASAAVVTQSANKANSFLDKPSNVAALATVGGVIVVGAAIGMGTATKCQKRLMRS